MSSELRSQNVFLLIVTGSGRVMIGKACRRSGVMTFIAGVGWGRERSECKEQSQHLHSSFVHVYKENRKGPSFYLLIIPSYTHLDHPLEFPLDESMAVSTMEERGRPKSSVVVPIQRYSWRRDGAIVCLLCGKTRGECLRGCDGGHSKIVKCQQPRHLTGVGRVRLNDDRLLDSARAKRFHVIEFAFGTFVIVDDDGR